MWIKKQQLEPDMANGLVQHWERSTSSLYIVNLLIYLSCRVHPAECRLNEQAGIKISGRNINNLRYTDDTTLMAEVEEELRGLLIKVKEKSEKVDLKLNIQKTGIRSHHFMGNRWGNNRKSDRFYLGGLQNHCR